MSANFYAKNPLKVAIVNPKNDSIIRTYIFLGQVPRSVFEAARRGDGGKWKSEDASTLKDYYGPRWKSFLSPEISRAGVDGMLESQLAVWRPDTLAALIERTKKISIQGGQEDLYDLSESPLRATFGNLEDFDAIDVVPEEDLQSPHIGEVKKIVRTLSTAPEDISLTLPGPPVYSTLAVYPEDTIADLKAKIFVATSISPHRQHLFYMGRDGLPRLPYRIYLESTPMAVDVRTMFQGDESIAGMPIDRKMEGKRNEIQIDALDSFQKLEIVSGSFLEKVYVVDLYSAVRPLGSGNHPDLPTVLRDKYQFDLLYYGGVLKYWPQLSPDALLLALSDPAGLRETYPLLAPNRQSIETKIKAEQTIVDKTYAFAPSRDPKFRPTIAVTHSIVNISPRSARMRINVRNVFDWIPTGWGIPAASVRFLYVDPTAGTSRFMNVVKRHASSFMPQLSASVDWFVAHIKGKSAVHFALSRPIQVTEPQKAESGQSSAAMTPMAYVTLQEDGKYSVESWWREDDRVSFDSVIGDILSLSGHLIESVNRMGEAAFPIGGQLRMPSDNEADATNSTTTFGAITASAFWPHAVTSAGFRELKDRWRIYEKAGIIGIRGLQQGGAFTFQFRKGITGYDPSAIERISIRRIGPSENKSPEAGASVPTGEGRDTVGVSSPMINNRYAYLTDPGIALRWNYLFGGRTVRIHHRATDLRVEVVGANGLEEFEIIRRYVFAFLEGARLGPDKIAGIVERTGKRAPTTETLHGPGTRRLRRLQERDPNLFDLKKYDPGATVYSVLCQAGRQPHVYTESEVASMSKSQKLRLSRYWNFTENNLAYYGCPSPQYPYMSWRSGKHPLGYCLPCCKKTQPAVGSRAALVNDQCLAKFVLKGSTEPAPRRPSSTEPAPGEGMTPSGSSTDIATSRHVLSYGKSIPIGRVSDVAPSVAGGLLLEAFPYPYALRMIGVEQHCPSVPSAGFMYSLALAIAISDESFDDVVAALCKTAIAIGDSYRTLGSGAASVFPSAHDLADSLISAFVRKDRELSPLGPGGAAGSSWEDIVTELAKLTYGVEVVRLIDSTGMGDVSLEVSKEAAVSFTGIGGCSPPPPRIVLIASGPMGTYPVFAMNTRIYLRAPATHRWMLARKVFEDPNLIPPPDFPEYVPDRVVEFVKPAVSFALAGNALTSPSSAQYLSTIDLGFMTKFACANKATGYTLSTKLIDSGNQCYGVILHKTTEKETKEPEASIYVPVKASSHVSDGVPAAYGPRPNLPLRRQLLADAVRDMNSFIKTNNLPYAAIVPSHDLVDSLGKNIGFYAEGLFFYHNAENSSWGSSSANANNTLPKIQFPYPPLEIDEAIYAASKQQIDKHGAPIDHALDTVVNKSSYVNRLYKMFVAEFVSGLRKERNSKIRQKLRTLVTKTQFNVPKSVGVFREEVIALLNDFPADLETLRNVLVKAYSSTSGDDVATTILATIEDTSFDFDKVTLDRLRKLSTDDSRTSAPTSARTSAPTSARTSAPTSARTSAPTSARTSAREQVAKEVKTLMLPLVELIDIEDPANKLGSEEPPNIFVACTVDTSVSRPQCYGGKLLVPKDKFLPYVDILASDIINRYKMSILSSSVAGAFDETIFIERPGERLTILD